MRATALTVWPALLAPILGPVLGGFITQTFDWRWNFWLNLPIGLAGALAVLVYVPKEIHAAERRLDVNGFVLCSLALTCLIAGFQRSSMGGAERWLAILLIVVGVAAGLAAVRHLRTAAAPLVELGPLRHLSFSHSSLFPGMLFRAQFSTAPFLLPLLFQLGFGMQPATAGVWVLVYFMGNLGIKPATSWILKTFGFRNVTFVNGLLVAFTMLACGFLTPDTPKIPMILLLLMAGASRSMQMTGLTTLVFADVGMEERNAASTLLSMLVQTSQAIGVAGGAFLLALFGGLHGTARVGLPELHGAFFVVAAVGLLGAVAFLRMPPDIGAEVSLHKPKAL
jgi:MFS family permease